MDSFTAKYLHFLGICFSFPADENARNPGLMLKQNRFHSLASVQKLRSSLFSSAFYLREELLSGHKPTLSESKLSKGAQKRANKNAEPLKCDKAAKR